MITPYNYLDESEHFNQVNNQLSQKLDEYVPSLTEAFEIILSILDTHGLSFDLTDEVFNYPYNEEGDELVFDLKMGMDSMPISDVFLYVIYYKTDDGQYDFFAEVTDEERLEELLSEDATD